MMWVARKFTEFAEFTGIIDGRRNGFDALMIGSFILPTFDCR